MLREYRLSLARGKWEIRPGVVADAVLYNSQVPGPVIRATEGDTVRVKLKNDLDEPTTIHWHGLPVPNKVDGMPPFSQTEVAPGAEFVYEFVVPRAGTFMYHPHGMMHREQIDRGAYGFVIIDSAEEDPNFDRDYSLMLSAWSIKGAPGDAMPDMGYNVYSVNGRSWPTPVILDVAEGELVRLRVGNLSSALAHPMHLHGHDFEVIAKDGNLLLEPYAANTINVAPGETYDLAFEANNPGVWVLHCHNLHHTPDMTVLVRYEGFEVPNLAPRMQGAGGESHSGGGMAKGRITKLDEARRLVFGWASVVEKAGEPVVDLQDDIIPALELEDAVYDYVLHSRVGGEMHARRGVSQLVESLVVTPEKLAQLGLDRDALPVGWWVGFKVTDDATWQDVVRGKYRAFSIGGSGKREAT